MLETCPRCSSRLGPPLNSGRQVCAQCGWSSAPASPKQAAGRRAKSESSSLMAVIQLCGRIVKRVFGYIFSLVRQQLQQLQQKVSKPRSPQKNMIQGLTQRLSALEEAIPASAEEAQARAWLTIDAAFQRLGGDPSDPASVVKTLNGQAAVSFARFRLLNSEAEFEAFGFEIDLARRSDQKPWLRQVS